MSHCINALIHKQRSLVAAQDNQPVLPQRAFKVEDFFPNTAAETFSAIPEEPATIEEADPRSMSHAALNRLVEHQLTAQQCDAYLIWCKERNAFQYDAANIQGFLIGETPAATFDRWRETMKERRLEAKTQENATEKAAAADYFEKSAHEHLQEPTAEETAEKPVDFALTFATYEEYYGWCDSRNSMPMSEAYWCSLVEEYTEEQIQDARDQQAELYLLTTA